MNGDNTDLWWQPEARSSVYLESVRDGRRVLLQKNISYAHNWFRTLYFSLSPDEKYVVYYDPSENQYFSYEISSKITRKITEGIVARWRAPGSREAVPQFGYPVGIAGWLEHDAAVLIYDVFDVWQVDPLGIKKQLNVTHGYGLRHHMRLRLTGDLYRRKPLMPRECMLLNSFDTVNKYSGFYSQSLTHSMSEPILLTMGPYMYGDPVRSENAKIWIVSRQSAKEAPNFVLTRDWKKFISISDVQPQRSYNWLTSELVKWTLPNGNQAQGILYKPEDFNEHKRYPLLIHYYEERSYELYKFKEPAVVRDGINIPYFVSRGYIVLIPDIEYKIGTPGESVMNTVLSGARYLCQYPWIDSTRMGLQGHSFGGWETNYLVTHTSLFAAAAEGAGSSNLISAYGGLFSGESQQYKYEMYQGRIRHSLWERPDLYIEASPIFRANQVTTPLLMVHNKKDGSVPWSQAVEFYTALRRLQKKVWMLQFDEGNHVIANEKDAMSLTIFMTQFFDHFLMGKPAPRWMIEGIPAKYKGVYTGLDLDDID